MSLLILSDFSGELNISQSKYGNVDYTSIIASVEETILKQLLGDDLYLKVKPISKLSDRILVIETTLKAYLVGFGVFIAVLELIFKFILR